MSKKIVLSGHTRINPGILEWLLMDKPTCQGDKRHMLCSYAHNGCDKSCYASQSLSCEVYGYLSRTRSYADKLGVVLR